MSVEIAWKQNILVTDFHLLKSLLVVLGFGSQAFICGFSRQNINSVVYLFHLSPPQPFLWVFQHLGRDKIQKRFQMCCVCTSKQHRSAHCRHQFYVARNKIHKYLWARAGIFQLELSRAMKVPSRAKHSWALQFSSWNRADNTDNMYVKKLQTFTPT